MPQKKPVNDYQGRGRMNSKSANMSTHSGQKRKEPSIPLSLPNRNRPPSNRPTLMEIAQARERKHQNQIGPQDSNNNNKGTKASYDNGGGGRSSDQDTEVMTIFEQSIFLAGTLAMLHFTIDVLVHHQYRQEVVWRDIIWRTAMNFPCQSPFFFFVFKRSSPISLPVSFDFSEEPI